MRPLPTLHPPLSRNPAAGRFARAFCEGLPAAVALRLAGGGDPGLALTLALSFLVLLWALRVVGPETGAARSAGALVGFGGGLMIMGGLLP